MSYAAILTAPPINNTDAGFRAWGQMVSNAIANCGWVAVENNINWGTITTPSVISQSKGYEIWRMADTLQATAPVYLKIEYGSGITSNTNPQMWFQVGSGSNGSGQLTGILSNRSLLGATASVNSIYTAVSGDTDRFCIAGWAFSINSTQNVIGGAQQAMMFSIERTKDGNGNNTAEGALLTYHTTLSAIKAQQYWNCFTGPAGQETGGWGAHMPTSAVGVAGSGIQTPVFPIYHNKGVFLNPGLNILCTINATFTELSTVSIPMYGANHTYLCLSGAMIGSTVTRYGSNSSFNMRYE